MKVIDLIQNMQAAIAALSYQPADTDVRITTSPHALTGTMTVKDEDGKITMTMASQVDVRYAVKVEDILKDYGLSDKGAGIGPRDLCKKLNP